MDAAKKRKKKIVIASLAAAAIAVVAGVAGAIVLLGGGVGSETRPVKISDALLVAWKPKPPESFYSPLSGLPLTDDAYLRRPLVVKVENEPPARPQTGLDRADIVYEVLMEGYDVTRFAAIYQSRQAPIVGPIRSARPADALIVPEYNGLFAHCGGTWLVLGMIKRAGIADLDQYFNEEAYWRVGFRSAPHNLYTSTSLLWQLAKRKKEYKPIRLPSFGFKDEETRPAGAISTIKIPFGDQTNVMWRYERRANAYLRFMQGEEHTDKVTGRQLKARNLILLYTKMTETNIVEDVFGSRSLKFDLIGSGKVTIFRDGQKIDGTWAASKSAPPVFSDSAGQPVLLNRGNSWIEVIPTGMKIVAR